LICKIARRLAPAVSLAAALAGTALHAQTITIAPIGYITAGPGGTQQFTATITGDTAMSAAVAWSAAGKAGGTSIAGTISSTGLYTAPMVPPASGQVQITATLSGSAKVSASTYIYILPAGPTITSVSPNPIPVGTDSITLTGSGFQKGGVIFVGGVQYGSTFVNSTTITTSIYQGPAQSTTVASKNSGSVFGNTLVVPVSGTSSGGAAGGTGGGGSGHGSGSALVIAPATVTVVLGATQQFTAAGATSWSAVSGTVSANGLYTGPASMPPSGNDTVTAKNSIGQSTATVTLLSNVPPTISAIGTSPLPLGVFSTSLTGSGFTAQSIAQLNGVNLTTVFGNTSSITVSGFAGPASSGNLTVANGSEVSQPFAVPIGVQNPQVSASAARRFLEQAAFGPTPADAAHVQTIGFQAWLAEQFAMPVVSNYNAVTGNQSGLPPAFLANAVTNSDQLRQRVAFALSQIFVVSITKLIWNGDVIPYEQMLLADAFTNYRKILGDVTLSPAMGNYLDMANNAQANSAAGTSANENFAREVMQLFSLGDVLLNQDGSVQTNANGPIPTYLQPNVTELARVFTGWTYAPASGQPVNWGAYITENGPMVNYDPMHDFGSKTLLAGYVAPANLATAQDLNAALDNIASHPNVAPFISKQLIQHLVKSNPTPAYVTRVAQAFTQSNGDVPTVVMAILLDTEARANDAGGNDQPTDGHLQEPALFIPGFVRAFSGTMTTANYYSQTLAALGQDIYNPASVFNYFSPGYTVSGTGGLKGPEFQIDNPNAAIVRENLVAQFFNQYSDPVQSNGPGTIVDLTPFLPLAGTPATLVAALDLTLTHGTMPAAMKQIIVTAVTADAANGSLRQVETGVYLILTSSYYNVWH
jgi:uncharacterized protein (DUF1800 family)